MADTTLAEFAGAGALTDVSAEIKAGNIDPNDYWSAAWEAAQYEGRYWGVPFVTATRALDYNTELFAQAGYAEPPHTLSELETAAQKLTIKSGNGDYKQFGFWPDGGNWFIWGWGWLFGGRYYDPATHTITADDPRVVEALTWEVTYARRYQKGAGGFCNGSLAMQIDNSPVMSSYLANCPGLRYDTAPVPPPADGQKATWSGVWMLAIPKGAKHPELARELIRFLSTDAVQQEFALAVTQIPTRKRAVGAVLPAMVQRYGHPAQVFLDLMPFTHVRPVLPIANLYWSKLIEAHDAAMSLKKTPKAALSDVTKDLQGRLDALIKQP